MSENVYLIHNCITKITNYKVKKRHYNIIIEYLHNVIYIDKCTYVYICVKIMTDIHHKFCNVLFTQSPWSKFTSFLLL